MAKDADALEDSWTPDDLNVSEQLLDAAIEQIVGLEDGARGRLRRELSRIGSSYLLEKFARPCDANPKKQKAAITGLISKLDRALDAVGGIAPEYWAHLHVMAVGTSHLDLEKTILDLRNAAAVFLAEYEPPQGPRTNIALEEAVRDMEFRFEELGIPFTISLNKHGEGGPRPTSPAAAAMVNFLRGLDAKLRVGTIINMIDKVRSQHDLSQTHFGAIWDADPDLNLSLISDPPDD